MEGGGGVFFLGGGCKFGGGACVLVQHKEQRGSMDILFNFGRDHLP